MDPLALTKFACKVKGVAAALRQRTEQAGALEARARALEGDLQRGGRALAAAQADAARRLGDLGEELSGARRQLTAEAAGRADLAEEVKRLKQEQEAIVGRRSRDLENEKAQRQALEAAVQRLEAENRKLRAAAADQALLEEACEKEIEQQKQKVAGIAALLQAQEPRLAALEAAHNASLDRQMEHVEQCARLRKEHRAAQAELQAREGELLEERAARRAARAEGDRQAAAAAALQGELAELRQRLAQAEGKHAAVQGQLDEHMALLQKAKRRCVESLKPDTPPRPPDAAAAMQPSARPPRPAPPPAEAPRPAPPDAGKDDEGAAASEPCELCSEDLPEEILNLSLPATTPAGAQ